MKQIIFFLLAATTTFSTFAQGAFNNVAITETDKTTKLEFTADNNVNVRHYRIEASNNQNEFKVIGTVPSKTNSMRPADYSYDLVGQDYKYYRVAKVAMDGSMPYSEVIIKEQIIQQESYQPVSTPTNLTAEVSSDK